MAACEDYVILEHGVNPFIYVEKWPNIHTCEEGGAHTELLFGIYWSTYLKNCSTGPIEK